jgi:ABC-type multidrug transport system fused ATPase/permease subunit
VRDPTLVSFYVRALREVFPATSWRKAPVIFVVASVLHSLGHAGLALVAGRCAVLLAGVMVGGGASGSAQGLKTAIALGALGIVAAVAKAGGGVVAAHGQATIASRVGGMLRLEVLDDWFTGYRLRRPRQSDHGQDVPPPGLRGTVDRRAASRTAARGVSDLTARVREVETGLEHGLLAGGRAIAQLIPLCAALVWISPRLAVASFAVLTPFSLLLSTSRRAWRRAHAAAARDTEDLLEAADEAVRHADLWVSYSAEDRARAAVADLGDALGRRAARIQASSAAMSGGNEVLAAIALVVALGTAQAGWLGDVGGGGRLLAFTVCFFLAYRPIRDLTEARLAWSRAAMAFAELGLCRTGPDRFIGAGATERQPPAASPPSGSWTLEDLRVDGLALRHGTTARVSFVLAAGEVVVVTGATGEGKTTLLRTLLGLEVARAGEVRYGEASLTSAPPGLLHRPFAWVPQDSALLTDTLEANVTLGVPTGAVDVRGALHALGADGLATAAEGHRLGPGGVMVSGGERQWIALARAMATRQPVLLLDEPTSGLDPGSQRDVLMAVARLRGTRSVVIVTHRAEPLELADTVVHLEGGRVRVEDGPARCRTVPAMTRTSA